MPVFFNGVNVLVRQIDPAGVGHFSVDGDNFPVVPIVLLGGKKRAEGIEAYAFNSKLPELLGIVLREKEEAADVIVDQPHLYAPGRFFL